MALVTLDVAKRHLKMGPADEDVDEYDLELKVDAASEIVLDYLKRPQTDWQNTSSQPDGVPTLVQAAVLIVLSNLYDDRDKDPLEGIENLLRRYRDPAMA